MKTTGVVSKAYLATWPDGQWFDDCDVTINGKADDDVELINDGDAVEFTAEVAFASCEDSEGKSLTPPHCVAQGSARVRCHV